MKTSGSRQIAERYVRALFDAAGAAREEVEKDLEALAASVKESHEFRAFITSPLLTRAQHEQALRAALKKAGAHEKTEKFIALLARQRRLALLPEIVALFVERSQRARGEMSAELVAAAPLDVRVVDMVGEKLGKAYDKKMILTVRHDPALLGGLVVKVGGIQLDGSLSGKLARLGQKLKAA